MSFGFIAVGLGASAATGVAIGAATLGTAATISESKKARKSQEAQAERAIAFQEEAQEEAQDQFAPFIQASRGSLREQQALTGLLGPEAQREAEARLESPTTRTLREQGFRGLDQRLAATGRLGGSERINRFLELSNAIDQQVRGQRFNELGAITGLGFGGAQGLSGIGAQTAAGQAGTARGIGQAQAADSANREAAFRSGISDLAGIGLNSFGGSFGSPKTEETNILAGVNLNG